MNYMLPTTVGVVVIATIIAIAMFRAKKNSSEREKNLLDLEQEPTSVIFTQAVNGKKFGKAPEVTVVSAIEQTRPSPERPITSEDAIVVDILRQNLELPGGITELSQLLNDPEAKTQKIVQIISTYPVLSAKILKAVNTAAFSSSKITSIQHAVVILGFNNLWLMVNQLLTNTALASLSNLSQEQMKALWRHGAAVATCANHLLLNTDLDPAKYGPIVYTCSLLHDIGKFLLRGLKKIDPVENNQCQSPSVLEDDKIFGLDHCRAAYLITTYWKLPRILCTTISYHHHPSFKNWQAIPKHARIPTIIVAIGDIMANMAGYYEKDPCTLAINPQCLEYIGLSPDWNPEDIINRELMKELKNTERLIEAATTV